ncbi:hypothetical protein BDQ17DRAFT_1436663 [Cyathus striatus]|nr:hypothetical protein BDQ17DRAFT_1436663 [Cyathus striatus]
MSLVLRKIFSYNTELINVGTKNSSIWDLRQVCIRWSNLVYDTPMIWSRFGIVGKPEVNKTVIDHRIQCCLKFSRDAPLAISFRLPISLSARHVIPRDTLVNLVDQADRWASLSIDIDLLGITKKTTIPTINQQRGFTELRKLILAQNEGVYLKSPSFDVFQNTHSIEELELYHIYFTDVFAIPVSKVKRLTIAKCQLDSAKDTFHSIFNSMHSLEELIWTDNVLHCPPGFAVITLPVLRTLSVTYTHSFELQVNVCKLLCLPALAKLESSFNKKSDIDSSAESLIAMIIRSRCQVSRLQLSSGPPNDIPIIEQFSCLIELSILDHADDSTMYKLIWGTTNLNDLSTGNMQLLPSLKKLELQTDLLDHPMILQTLLYVLLSRSSSTEDRGKQMHRPNL